MSEIYDALKKAEREKEGREAAPRPAIVEDVSQSGLHEQDSSSPHSVSIEEYEKMYSALKMAATDNEIRTILLLSSAHGEGTSSVCTQFAASLVQGDGGEKILLVDANLRTPALHQYFDLDRDRGLVEVLEGKIKPGESAKRTEYPGLFVVTAGEPTEDAPRLLGSASLKEALKEWSKEFSLVIFDSPPVLAYADAVVLGRLFDGVVLVVEAGKTRWEIVQRAQGVLKNAKANVVGVVLNKRQYLIPKRVYKRL